jgi:hypothetical protein
MSTPTIERPRPARGPWRRLLAGFTLAVLRNLWLCMELHAANQTIATLAAAGADPEARKALARLRSYLDGAEMGSTSGLVDITHIREVIETPFDAPAKEEQR